MDVINRQYDFTVTCRQTASWHCWKLWVLRCRARPFKLCHYWKDNKTQLGADGREGWQFLYSPPR